MYDKKFFDKKSIIFCSYYVSGCFRPQVSLEKVEVNERIVEISLVQEEYMGGCDRTVEFAFILEVEKKVIGNPVSIEIYIKPKQNKSKK